ncbi:hypothetical protein PPGU16_79170 (plasmid) [Paraburkholderia largidicola]|uniref:Uncharacterized protein n=1 Tax=Paraburkholderia largidicola TaxID=3014751 RepID=A0A7I8C4H1_9BURK|nr:hypothetical protein PPGU16_79170 [Paraburkholderia sp. PGU16]
MVSTVNRFARTTPLYFRTLQKIIEAADPIPPIAIRFEHHCMTTVSARLAVVVRKQIDQTAANRFIAARAKLHRAWLGARRCLRTRLLE